VNLTAPYGFGRIPNGFDRTIMQRIAYPLTGIEAAKYPEGEGVSLFHRIVVILDRRAPHQGAFSLALDWASRLGFPLVGVVGDTCERESACVAACARLQVPFETLRHKDRKVADLLPLAGPTDLLVFGHALPAEQKKNLLHFALRDASPAILVSQDAPASLCRILLLDQRSNDLAGSLPAVEALHRVFGAKLIVLTVARSEKEARLRQLSAQRTLINLGLHADFDAVIGSEVRVAVVGVARWRRCQLVVMSRHVSRPWWRWLRDSSPDWFMGMSQPLAFLSLPEMEPSWPLPATAKGGDVPWWHGSAHIPGKH
jgi:hypothetical protein